jgi:peptide/nickel transport system ATP-binding protein
MPDDAAAVSFPPPSPSGPPPVLSVRDLRVRFRTDDGPVTGVDGLSFDVEPGQILGIVGESGSGKSATSLSVLGLLGGAEVSGEIWFGGCDLVGAPDRELRRLRGADIAMIFQDPLSALHPYYSVGRQISEAYLVHHRVGRRAAKTRALEMLDRVGIPDPRRRYDDFPHQFSGGMRQRAMIAMALVCTPKLLIADEPTTALDVTVQAQILELVKGLRRDFGTAVVLVTHDLGVVAETCDSVVVMYAGQCVEQGPVAEIFARPQMPYTWGLLGSMPRVDRARRARLTPIAGQPPSRIGHHDGCAFGPRCRFRDVIGDDRCESSRPALEEAGRGHKVRCHISPAQRQDLWSAEIGPVQ